MTPLTDLLVLIISFEVHLF